MQAVPTFSKNHMKRPCAFAITAHAMVQYLNRGTRYDVKAARHALHKKRRKTGQIAKTLTDKDFLEHLAEGRGCLGHRATLEHRLKKSWRIHDDKASCFRLLEGKLVAVMNAADNTVVTILTQEIAQKKVPVDLTFAFDVYSASLTAQLLNSQSSINIKGTDCREDNMTSFYSTVTKDSFDCYPGEKRRAGEGNDLVYEVRNDEERPLSDRQREFADKLLELFKETGLSEQLAVGGLQAQLALSTIAAATVTATDESLPQYARAAVTSLAQEVSKQAHDAKCWNAGAVASRRNHTVVQVREAEATTTLTM